MYQIYKTDSANIMHFKSNNFLQDHHHITAFNYIQESL